jgi:hypothetical protein
MDMYEGGDDAYRVEMDDVTKWIQGGGGNGVGDMKNGDI